MKYAELDTNEGYWGDDDLTRDDSSESDPASPSVRSSRSDKAMTDVSMTPSPLGTHRGFGFNTPSRETRPASQPCNFESNSINAMPPSSSRFSKSTTPPPRRPPPPGTPGSRKRHIKEAFQATSAYSLNLNEKMPIKPAVRTVLDEDRDEEQEVSMILTDSELGQESPTTSSSSTSLTLSLPEESFSSVNLWQSHRTPSRRERKSTSPVKNPIPQRAITSPSSGFDSNMRVSEIVCTPKKTRSLPPRSEGTSSSNITNLFNMSLDSTLESKEIEHDAGVQGEMERLKIPWGVQYELARGVSLRKWKWSQVTPEKLKLLEGSNANSAYKVIHVMLNRPVTKKADLALWQQLDREEEAIIENKGRGIGLMGPWKGEPEWHGGRIQQLARLYSDDSGEHIKLEPMEMRRSHRFARYCGSRRILQVRIPDDIRDNDKVRKYLCHKFILCGRAFVPFHAKEGSVYMVQVVDPSQPECGDQFLMTFSQFVNWHNPLSLNKTQPVTKYASRFALGLSNSVPVIEFQADCIEFIDDQIAADWDRSKKPPSEKTMTDGCGFINRAAMMEITRKMKYGSRPTAVQGRIGGAKGLWILDPNYDRDHRPRIWIRDSQNKIKYVNLEDRSHRILELLCVSQPPTSIALSEQTILNLYYNGVPGDTLMELLKQGIQHEAAPLMDWDKPMQFLWHAINKAGHVTGSRAARLAAGRSRALGLSRQEWGPQWINNDDVLSDEHAGDDLDSMEVDGGTMGGAYSGRNQYSGSPLGLHESALELVQAGFTPMDLKALHDKIRFIMRQIIDSAVQKYHIPLRESISALVVPDPLGVLKEGEIYFKSSQVMVDPETATTFNVLKGEVLVGRYPVRLASDIQKVTAIDIMELSDWSDVIIVSTKGERSAANILSGGDYDGDELFIIRESCLVKPFQNKSLIPEPPNLQKECFDVSAESVEQLSWRPLDESNMQHHFQFELLSGLNDAKVGLYSRFHEFAIYKFGYSHEDTIRMAYMFTIALDSGKTGLRLKHEVFKKHRNKFMGEISEDEDFILNNLVTAGREMGDELLQQYDLREQQDDVNDLKEPWNKALEKAKKFDKAHNVTTFHDAMKVVSAHVDVVYNEWYAVCVRPKDKEGKSRQKKRQRRSRGGEDDPMLKVSAMFHQKLNVDFLLDDVEVLKASYASKRSIKFALSLAFNLVCQIKAKVSPHGYAPCTRIFDEMKSMGPSSLRALGPPDEDVF